VQENNDVLAYFSWIAVVVIVYFERFVNFLVLEQLADCAEDGAEPEQRQHDPDTDSQPVPRTVSSRRVLTCALLNIPPLLYSLCFVLRCMICSLTGELYCVSAQRSFLPGRSSDLCHIYAST